MNLNAALVALVSSTDDLYSADRLVPTAAVEHDETVLPPARIQVTVLFTPSPRIDPRLLPPVMLCYVILCYVMLCSFMLFYVSMCYVMLCHVMLCCFMLCYVMMCYVILRNIMHCDVM